MTGKYPSVDPVGSVENMKFGMDTFGFLIRLKKIDKLSLTCRDVISLFFVMGNPGCNGVEMAKFCGVTHRASIVLNLKRLLAAGFIEDRRIKTGKAYQNRLYVTQAGIDFWNEIKP